MLLSLPILLPHVSASSKSLPNLESEPFSIYFVDYELVCFFENEAFYGLLRVTSSCGRSFLNVGLVNFVGVSYFACMRILNTYHNEDEI